VTRDPLAAEGNGFVGHEPGTLDTAIERLSHVGELGANAVRVMPLAEFPGNYSWGCNLPISPRRTNHGLASAPSSSASRTTCQVS
jgi:hypothetical protein